MTFLLKKFSHYVAGLVLEISINKYKDLSSYLLLYRMIAIKKHRLSWRHVHVHSRTYVFIILMHISSFQPNILDPIHTQIRYKNHGNNATVTVKVN